MPSSDENPSPDEKKPTVAPESPQEMNQRQCDAADSIKSLVRLIIVIVCGMFVYVWFRHVIPTPLMQEILKDLYISNLFYPVDRDPDSTPRFTPMMG